MLALRRAYGAESVDSQAAERSHGGRHAAGVIEMRHRQRTRFHDGGVCSGCAFVRRHRDRGRGSAHGYGYGNACEGGFRMIRFPMHYKKQKIGKCESLLIVSVDCFSSFISVFHIGYEVGE